MLRRRGKAERNVRGTRNESPVGALDQAITILLVGIGQSKFNRPLAIDFQESSLVGFLIKRCWKPCLKKALVGKMAC